MLEYTHTIRDLTGVPLSPAKEFPIDRAAGEGFTNTGDTWLCPRAVVTKYLDAAKEIADHAVLLPDGFRFSPDTTRRDWTNELVSEIRKIYMRHTSGDSDVSGLNGWGVADPTKVTESDGSVDLERYFAILIEHREQLKSSLDSIESIADKEHLNARYLRRLAEMLLPASKGGRRAMPAMSTTDLPKRPTCHLIAYANSIVRRLAKTRYSTQGDSCLAETGLEVESGRAFPAVFDGGKNRSRR